MSAPFMQLYVADYLGDTRHLTTEQHGAYLLILMTMWRSGGRLQNDAKKLARITGCTPSRWARIAAEVMEFFDVQGGDITNPRLVLELEKASEKSIQRANAGSLGGKANALKNNKPDRANATPPLEHSSEPEPEREEEAKASVGSQAMPTIFDLEETTSPEPKPDPWTKDANFAAFWKAATEQGRKRSSQAKAWAEWRKAIKVVPAADLAASMPRYVAGDEDCKRTGGPGLHLWLRDRKFEHWIGAGTAGGEEAAATFDGPPALRASVVEVLGEAFARSWIDTCVWDAGSRTLLARNAFGASKLNTELEGWMRKMNVKAAVKGDDL